ISPRRNPKKSLGCPIVRSGSSNFRTISMLQMPTSMGPSGPGRWSSRS
ncbi:unnamed protein product, partial [Musa acuminata subsp. burmannicoides]